MQPEEHNGQHEASQSQTDDAGAPRQMKAAREISRRRLTAIRALIGVTAVLGVIAMFAIWANRLLFSPENWSNASSQLLEDPDVRSATANYLVDQLYAEVDVAALIRSGLPGPAQGLAAPIAGAVRNGAVQAAELALTRPRVQALWTQANRAADELFITIVNGGNRAVAINQGGVTLNLGPILDEVAVRLGLPSNLSARLPRNIASLTVFRSDQIQFVQDAGNAIRGLALWLTIAVPLLFALALVLARGYRRQTLMTIGFAGVFAGVLVLFGRSVLETQLTNSLTDDAALRPAIRATIEIGTDLLSQVAGAVILIGVVLIVAAWFAGPARVARVGRQAIAPFLRERPAASFAITLGVMALMFIWNPIPATGKPVGIIVFTLLALLGTEILIRQTIREFPDARSGAALHAARGRWTSLWRRDANAAVAVAPASTAEQLKALVELRDSGQITSDEYQSAKAQLLHR